MPDLSVLHPQRRVSVALIATILLSSLAWLSPGAATAPADASGSVCAVARSVAHSEADLAQPLQLTRVFEALSADLVVYVFAAPQLELRLLHDDLATAHTNLTGNVIELTDALLALGLSDDELYAALAHEAFHQVLHKPRTPCEAITEAAQRQQELEADHEARELMRSAGRDVGAMARVLRRLADLERAPEGTLAKTHPSFEARIDRLRG